jgi:hypothetical protein
MRRGAIGLTGIVLVLSFMGPVIFRPLAPSVAAAAPVDIRGTWSGIYHANIGDFPNTDVWTTEDFTSGDVSGIANDNTYTLTGTISGNQLHFLAAQDGGSYVATSDAVISADGTSMTGTGTDTNGNSGTFTFARQTPVPSPSNGATPSAPPASTPVVNPPGVVPPNPAPGCVFGGFGSGPPPKATTTTDASIVGQIGSKASDKLSFPGALAVDAAAGRDRVFIASGTSAGELDVVDGLSRDPSDLHVVARVAVGRFPAGIAVAPDSGRVYVAVDADCRIAVVDGRAATPALLTSIDLPGNPAGVAWDAADQRLFVALPEAGEIAVIGADQRVDNLLKTPGLPQALVFDDAHDWLYVAGPNALAAQGAGTISVISGKDLQPIGAGLVLPAPSGLVLDPAINTLFAVQDQVNQVTTVTVGSDANLKLASSVLANPDPSAQGAAETGAMLTASDRLLVPVASTGTASLFTIGPTGTLTFERSINGVRGGGDAINDPSTGRTYVSEAAAGEVAVLTLDTAAAAQALPFVLPGPFDISLAPADVARSIGITTFIMLLLGAPTPIFNSTLATNRALIERYARRKRPRALRRPGGKASPLGRITRQLVAWSHTRTGLVLYLCLAALLYAFLDATFPFQNAARTFGTTLFGIAVGTAVSQVPGELYVRRRYKARGKVKVALWTLVLAAACVLITRLTGVQPGYVYGIIGGFTFGIALTADDQGRMAFRGMSILLVVGLAAWFARIPFEPSVGVVSGDTGAVVNQVLAEVFIGAVQGTAIGLIPLKFLAGETLFSWNRRRWAVLWGAAILFFAHVVLYPVSSFTPNPSPTGVYTILLTVVVYGAIALGFWWFFRRRAIRHERFRVRAAAIFATAEPAASGAGASSPAEPPVASP